MGFCHSTASEKDKDKDEFQVKYTMDGLIIIRDICDQMQRDFTKGLCKDCLDKMTKKYRQHALFAEKQGKDSISNEDTLTEIKKLVSDYRALKSQNQERKMNVLVEPKDLKRPSDQTHFESTHLETYDEKDIDKFIKHDHTKKLEPISTEQGIEKEVLKTKEDIKITSEDKEKELATILENREIDITQLKKKIEHHQTLENEWHQEKMKLKKDFEDKIEKNENCKKDMENEIKNLSEKLQKTTIEKEESNKRLVEEVSELNDKIRTQQGYQKEREYAEELLKVERDRLEKEKKEISETLQNIKQELVRETTKNQNLRQKSDQVEKQWNEERMTLKEDISDGSVIIETLQNEKKNYMKEIENLNHEVKHHKQKVEGAKDDIKSKEEENKQLQQQYQKIQEMCNQKQAEIERMKLEHSESKKHLVSKEESIIKLKKDIETLELGIRNKSERNKAILEENIVLKKKLETTNGKVESLTKDLEKKSSEAEKTSVNLQSKERENKQLRDDMEKKDEEIGRLERQIAKPPIVLGIRNTKSGLSSKDSKMITEELSRILESRFKRENIDLKIKPCTTPQENPNGPLLVLCLSTTRIGSNVKDALEGIRASKDIAVLVMHHMKQEDLSSMYHTKHQIGGQYKELGGIFDMVFLGDQGVYDCEFNAETIQHLSTLIMQYSRRY